MRNARQYGQGNQTATKGKTPSMTSPRVSPPSLRGTNLLFLVVWSPRPYVRPTRRVITGITVFFVRAKSRLTPLSLPIWVRSRAPIPLVRPIGPIVRVGSRLTNRFELRRHVVLGRYRLHPIKCCRVITSSSSLYDADLPRYSLRLCRRAVSRCRLDDRRLFLGRTVGVGGSCGRCCAGRKEIPRCRLRGMPAVVGPRVRVAVRVLGLGRRGLARVGGSVRCGRRCCVVAGVLLLPRYRAPCGT